MRILFLDGFLLRICFVSKIQLGKYVLSYEFFLVHHVNVNCPFSYENMSSFHYCFRSNWNLIGFTTAFFSCGGILIDQCQ